MNFNIRRISFDTLNETIELIRKVFDEFEAPFYSQNGVNSFYKYIEKENLINLFGNGLDMYIAQIENEVVGVIACKSYEHISLLFVDKSYHKQGIGTYLINYVKKECKKNKRDIEYITVNSSPYAFEFYKKMGFEAKDELQEKDGIKYIPMNLKINNAYGKLELVFPTENHKDAVMEYLNEFFENGEKELAGDGGLDELKNFDVWLKKINNDLNIDSLDDGRVQATMYLAIRKSDKRIIGNIQIRHTLNEFLLKYGGHIGDSIRPSERKKGYASEMIRLALEECKKLNIKNVLMTCNKENIASAKSIINNGGILENEIIDIDESIKQRYWISETKRFEGYMDSWAEEVVTKKIYEITEDFSGDIYFIKFNGVKKELMLSNGLKILGEGYMWLEFYDYNSNAKMTAVYDNNGEFTESYIDIAREIGKENDIPYEDDLYLDFSISKLGIRFLDEDELEEALGKNQITKSDYELAKNTANCILKKLDGDYEKVKKFSDGYIRKFI